MNWQQILINIAITLAAALLTALGSWVLVKVKNLVATKIKNTKTQALLLGAVDVVASVVKATYQTYVQAIKGTEAWTQEAQKTPCNKHYTMRKCNYQPKQKTTYKQTSAMWARGCKIKSKRRSTT